jgi:hypothetical protein
MDRPLSAVVRVAATPEQAKLYVALLQAQGIPAYVDGGMLADEVATSRALMNLAGTNVLVPTASLERAREILSRPPVEPAELERQALAAADPERLAKAGPPTPPGGSRELPWVLVVAIAAAGIFLCLWLSERAARTAAQDPRFVYETDSDTGVVREMRSSDRQLIRSLYDRNRNFLFDRVTLHRPDGSVSVTSTDVDEDGVFDSSEERHADGVTATWNDSDHDGLYEGCRVVASDGRVIQDLIWQPGRGYVPKIP